MRIQSVGGSFRVALRRGRARATTRALALSVAGLGAAWLSTACDAGSQAPSSPNGQPPGVDGVVAPSSAPNATLPPQPGTSAPVNDTPAAPTASNPTASAPSATAPTASGVNQPSASGDPATDTPTPPSGPTTGTPSEPVNTATESTSTVPSMPSSSVPDTGAETTSTDPSAEPTSTSGGESTSPATDVSVSEFLAQSALGWNLGNSLDVPEGETAWGNPLVSPALLQSVATAGFDIVRVPVTWSMFLGPGPLYTIDPARVERVKEVVGYVLDSGMRAIINVHHDGADDYAGVEWLSLNDASGDISEAHNAAVEAQFVAVWSQLAQQFEGYGPELLFESMNEIHDGYDAPDPAYYTFINHLNQVFVDTVRASGGNNATRYLVVPGYNTNIDYTLEGFELPNDSAPNKLALSVHFYDPWSFAGEGSTAAWGAASPGSDAWGQEDYVVTQFDRLQAEYVQQGVPVVVGEYGAVNQTGSESYRRYYMEYVTQAASQRGLLPVYWDNGGVGSGAENFGLFDRTSASVVFPDVVAAMVRASRSESALDTIAAPTNR